MLVRMGMLLGALTGCHGKNRDENLGVVGAGAVGVLDVQQLQKPEVLVAALRLPGAERDRALGAHQRQLKQTLHMEFAGRPAEDLVLDSIVISDGKGAFHLIEDTGKTSGMEAVATAGMLSVRPKDGQFVRRRPEPGELDRLRRTVEEPLAATLELLRPALAIERAGAVDSGGRTGTRLVLSKAASPNAAPAETEPGRKWRESVQVESLSGEVVVDASGVPLSAKLDAVYRFRRDSLVVKVTVAHTESLSAAETITAPANAVASPERPRPMVDRQTLLEGIAPPRREVSALH